MNTKTVQKLSYGVYLISSKLDDKLNAQIANVVFQTTADPQMIAVCLNKNNLTYEFVSKSKIFAVSVLSQKTPFSFIGTFGFKSGRDINKFKEVHYKTGTTGAPIVTDNAVAFLEAAVIDQMCAGTHSIFLAKIIDSEILNDDIPMTYDYYHNVIKGKSPKNAPTYVSETTL